MSGIRVFLLDPVSDQQINHRILRIIQEVICGMPFAYLVLEVLSSGHFTKQSLSAFHITGWLLEGRHLS